MEVFHLTAGGSRRPATGKVEWGSRDETQALLEAGSKLSQSRSELPIRRGARVVLRVIEPLGPLVGHIP